MQEPEERRKMDEKWKTLNRMLKKRMKNYEEPETPFNERHLVGEFNSLYSRISDKDKYVNF